MRDLSRAPLAGARVNSRVLGQNRIYFLIFYLMNKLE